MNSRRREGRKHLTVRNVPPELARALRAEQRRRATTLNQTVIDVLSAAVGLRLDLRHRNGLEVLAGGWSARDLTDFEEATAVFESVDEDLWR